MKKKRYKTEAKKQREFSKRVIAAIICLWFFVAVFGIAVLLYQLSRSPEYVTLDSLYAFVGAPVGGGIVGYLVKSALENKEKIKNNNPQTEDLFAETPIEKG